MLAQVECAIFLHRAVLFKNLIWGTWYGLVLQGSCGSLFFLGVPFFSQTLGRTSQDDISAYAWPYKDEWQAAIIPVQLPSGQWHFLFSPLARVQLSDDRQHPYCQQNSGSHDLLSSHETWAFPLSVLSLLPKFSSFQCLLIWYLFFSLQGDHCECSTINIKNMLAVITNVAKIVAING